MSRQMQLAVFSRAKVIKAFHGGANGPYIWAKSRCELMLNDDGFTLTKPYMHDRVVAHVRPHRMAHVRTFGEAHPVTQGLLLAAFPLWVPD